MFPTRGSGFRCVSPHTVAFFISPTPVIVVTFRGIERGLRRMFQVVWYAIVLIINGRFTVPSPIGLFFWLKWMINGNASNIKLLRIRCSKDGCCVEKSGNGFYNIFYNFGWVVGAMVVDEVQVICKISGYIWVIGRWGV